MHFLFSPWFIGLNIVSFLIMTIELWGLKRAYRRHNTSPIGQLCGKTSHFPTTGMMILIGLYIFMTLLYIFLPPLFHDLVI